MKSRNQSRIEAIVFRAVGLINATACVVTRLFDNTLRGNAFAYFDTQVVTLVAVAFAVLLALTIIEAVKNGQTGDSPTFSFIAHSILVALVVADTVLFWAVTSWLIVPDGFLFTPYNIIAHMFLPVIVVIDWFFFLPHGNLRFYYTAFSVIFPAVYFGIVLIISSTGFVFSAANYGEFYREVVYPYFFLQYNVVGGVGVLIPILLAFAAVFYGFAALLYLVDVFPSLKGRKKPYKFYDPKKERIKRNKE